MTRIIKRYKNRKLYDAQEARYMNLGEIYQLVRAGQKVLVVDNTSETPQDVTSIVLLRALIEQGEKEGKNLTTETLTSVINSFDGTLKGFIEQPK